MKDREEIVRVPFHPGIAGREHQAGPADGEEQHERQDVLAELLQRDGGVINHAAPEREHHAGDDEERRPHEPVKDHEGRRRLDREVANGKSEDERAVRLEMPRHGLEVNPAPHERKRDQRRDDAAPHDQPMRQPSETAAPEDENIRGKHQHESAEGLEQVGPDESRAEKHRPPASPVQPRGRTLQPHCIAVRDAEGREQRGECVADERRVEVIQVPRTDDDERGEHGREEESPRCGFERVRRDACHASLTPQCACAEIGTPWPSVSPANWYSVNTQPSPISVFGRVLSVNA